MAAVKKIVRHDERTEQITVTPEYNIYIFYPQKRQDGPDWERTHTTLCAKQARLHAEELMQTNSYPKVEIRKKYFDARKDCKVDCAVKIYEKNPERNWSRIALVAALMAMAAMLLLIHPS